MTGSKLWTYLLGLLVVVGGYYVSEYYQARQQAQEQAAKQIFIVNAEDITAFTLKRGPQEIRLKKDKAWQILQPLKTRADKFTVNSLLDTLSKLKKQRELEVESEKLSDYGLDHPGLIVDFHAGDKDYQLRIGNKTPGGRAYYAQTDREAKVLLISAADRGSLDRNLTALRDKTIFTFSPDKVRELDIRTAKPPLKLKKTKATWTLKGHPQTRIRADRIDSLLRQLSLLRAREFVSETPEDLKKYGLDPKKAIRLTVYQGKDKETLFLGGKKGEQIYAHKSGANPVILVDKAILERLPTSEAQLEDRRLWAGKEHEVQKLAWGPPERQVKAIREKDKWTIAAPQGKVQKPSPFQVTGVLWRLKELEYTRLLPADQPIGAKPLFSLKLWGKEDKLLLNLKEFPAEAPDLVRVQAIQGKQTVDALVSKQSFTAWRQELNKLSAPPSSASK